MKPAELYTNIQKLTQLSDKIYDAYKQLLLPAANGALLRAFNSLGAEPTQGKRLQNYRLAPGMSKERKLAFKSFFQEAETNIKKIIPRMSTLWTQYLRAADTLQAMTEKETKLDLPEDQRKQMTAIFDHAAIIKQAQTLMPEKFASQFMNTQYFMRELGVLSGIERVLNPEDYVKALFGMVK